MTEIERQIADLTKQLQELRSRQMQMNAEMVSVERQLTTLKAAVFQNAGEDVVEKAFTPQTVQPAVEAPYILKAQHKTRQEKILQQKKRFHVNQEMEDFIGTNLTSKIGILVTIVGVFIGAKYAIDNELISPFMRILAGYLSAGILIFIAFTLKKKYEYFSSVLIAGGLAVTYFITYIAYSFYALFPLAVAFIIMVITTAVAVAIALWYSQKVIALLGQVAAYAIPFLLGDGQGNIFILFGYITVINFGLLLLSFKKDWKLLYHIAFFLTWLIYLLSIVSGAKVTSSFAAGLTFLAINFFTFYVTFLAYKIFKKELYNIGEIAILLLNALFFFFLGTYLIDEQFDNIHFLTWFTIANASIHLSAGYFIYRLRLVDDSVFQFILGLGLLFITIAIPIELDGNWVTLLWTIEGTALTYVACKNKRQLYLEIALPLIVISFISLLQDWYQKYPFIHGQRDAGDYISTPFININVTLSLFVCVSQGFMSFWANNFHFDGKSFIRDFFVKILPVAFLALLYFTLYNEIHYAWDKTINSNHDQAAVLFQSVTLLIFSCLYLAAWLWINSRSIKNEKLHHLLIVLALFANAAFLFDTLLTIGDLREKYMHVSNSSKSWLIIRYFAFAAVAILWLSAWYAFRFFKPTINLQRSISSVFNITLLSVISNEFIHWMDLAGYQNQYKLGLSLICGGYALALLFAGIVKKKKHLRISAMTLFAATLLKLFFYDLASLSTISKTIVLVLLGILLLLASFLYNKYKELLFPKEETS